MDDIVNKYEQWKRHIPRVKPFYAMKCNDALPVVEALAHLGIGFDCASSFELDRVIKMGVKPDRIVFANPCKSPSMIRFAKQVGVTLTTVDSVCEVVKIHSIQPKARLLIRLKVDDTASKYKLGDKFGAKMDEVDQLLLTIKMLEMNVVGVAFHIGSDCSSSQGFATAIELAFQVSKKLNSYGFSMEILDIGGGFPGDIDFNDENDMFFKMAKVVNDYLEKYFPEEEFPSLSIISEPGRYFVSSAFYLLTKIVGKKFITKDSCHKENIKDMEEVMYYLNDGLFGGFLIKFWEPEMIHLKPILLNDKEPRKQVLSTFWGPTCDSSDFVLKKVVVNEMFVGEYLITSKYGAYTVPLTTPFNGMEKPIFKTFYGNKSSFLRDENLDQQSIKVKNLVE